MKEVTLMEIDKVCVNAIYWDGAYSDELSLSWVEKSNSYHADNVEVEVEITKDKAAELIEVLKKHFNL